jgi:2-polyprenyl-3-methyl-5-hydroxy-6-metoxy-1,4-benzoquinol methylase
MTCRICGGALRLLYTGAGLEARSEAFSPTNHAPRAYQDLYRCEACGTVAQPSLPRGEALQDLYRHMRDDRYLNEEKGRRATANRILDVIGKRVPSGRLLDVGCGHGLLLDEAKKRGYTATGLEPSTHAAQHARDNLDLDIRAETVEQHQPRQPYGVIVLADVLEHLDDPPKAIQSCARMLSPGGVLCLVTPDPASRTAQIAGKSWWGYLPAHTYLLPRQSLRDLLEQTRLDITDDVPLVRTFTLRYWMAGLAERGGAIGKAVTTLQQATPKRARLSLSLGDERVIVAQRGARYASDEATGAPSPPAAVASSSTTS